MQSQNSIFIWQGSVHLGDEPGIYGNSQYSGLSVRFPITVKAIDPSAPATDTISLEITSENINNYAPYLGQKVIVTGYTPDPTPTNKYKWKETVLVTDFIKDSIAPKIVNIPVTAPAAILYLSVAIEVDTEMQPGLYDDFLITRLRYTTANSNYYLEFGFNS